MRTANSQTPELIHTTEFTAYVLDDNIVYAEGQRIKINSYDELNKGDIITFSGEVYEFEQQVNEAGFNSYNYYKARQVDYCVDVESYEVVGHKEFFISKINKKVQEIYETILPEKDA